MRFSRRRLLFVGIAALVVVGGVVTAVVDPFTQPQTGSSGVADNAYPTSTQAITMRSLSSQTEVSATLGYAGSYTMALPSGTSAGTLRQDRSNVQAAQQTVADAEQALAHAKALETPTSASTLRSAEATVHADETDLAQAKAQLAADKRLNCPASSSATVTSSSGGSNPGSSSPGSSSPGSSNPGSSSPGSSNPGSSSPGSSSPGNSSPGNSSPGSSNPGSSNPGSSSPGGSSPGGTSPGSGSPGSQAHDARLTVAVVSRPTVSTGSGTATGSSTATLSGTVNPNGSDTTYAFEYGTTAAFGHTTTSKSAGSGTSAVSVTADISGLKPDTTYHFALVATSSQGTVVGSTATFQTSAKPTVNTGSGTATGSSTATLSGTVNPNGLDTSYEFKYGTTAAFGHTTTSKSAGSGTSPVSATADITGLKPDTTYDVELVATNALGTAVGATGTFKTSASSCADQSQVVAQDKTALATAKDALAEDRLSAGASVTQAQQSLTSDERSLSTAEQAMASDEQDATNPGATVTSLPTSGQVVRRGQALYALDGHPVPLFYGTVTPYRSLYLGVSDGPDVKALEENLAALGFLRGVAPSNQFTAATQAAVEAWQGSLGMPATGVVALGDIAYSPGPIQVDAVSATTGQAATPGLAVLSATSTTPEVTIALDASQQSEVKVGDAVSIVLPSNATTPGVVSSVGSVATTPSSSGPSGSGTPTITVEVTPTKPAQLGHLDQASVNVWITTASVAHAYVVPVDALLALSSGGYALEVVGSDHVHHLVAVQLGLFDDADGLVQVSGTGVTAGERVVVPAL